MFASLAETCKITLPQFEPLRVVILAPTSTLTSWVALPLSDDSFAEVTPPQSVSLYGTSYNSLFVGSNGYITFGAGDSDFSESLADHFDLPRISGAFDDLNPGAGGTVS